MHNTNVSGMLGSRNSYLKQSKTAAKKCFLQLKNSIFAFMKINQLQTLFHKELASLFPKTEIDSFYNILVEHKLGMTRIDRAMQPQFELNREQTSYFTRTIEALRNETPVQYITGTSHFYGSTFNVNSNVLIPRPETEDLVSWILEDIRKEAKIDILDIGTGSGCIAISLAKNLKNATVWALDFSEDAIQTAKVNALANKVDIQFLQQDILKTHELDKSFDIIVSNPPYVRELEKKEIQKNVLAYEPHSALFVEDTNPLIFYDKITTLAGKHLNPNGKLYFEINQYLATEMMEMLRNKGFTKNELRKDIFGNDRMTKSMV